MEVTEGRTAPAGRTGPGPERLFTRLALAEAVTWTLLLAGMAQKYLLDAGEWGVRLAGPVHGFVFLAFCVTVVLVAVNNRWSWAATALALAAAVPPLATVPLERAYARRGLLAGEWRREPAGDPRDGRVQDRLLRLALARPWLAAAVALAAVTVVFSVLLLLGPPVEPPA